MFTKWFVSVAILFVDHFCTASFLVEVLAAVKPIQCFTMEVAPCMIDLKRNTKTQITFKFVYNLRAPRFDFMKKSSSFFLRNPIWHFWYLRPRIRLPYFEFETGRILEWLFIIEGLVSIFLSIGKANAMFWWTFIYPLITKKKN